MREANTIHAAESRESLWRLVVSPLIWAAHFMASYVSAAIWCAKFADTRGSSLGPVWPGIAVLTAIALAGIAASAWSGFQRHRLNCEPLPHDADTRGDRHRFLGFATLLLSVLSAVATVFSGLVILYLRDCR